MGLNYSGVVAVAQALGIEFGEEAMRLTQRLETSRMRFLADQADKQT